MATEKDSAYVLRLVDFSESSSVVTMLTRDHGRISALAKGAHRRKGPFDSALDLLTQSRIVFLRKSSGSLDLLTEAKLQWRFRPPGLSLAPLYAGYYVAELLLNLTGDYDPHPKLFDLTDNILQGLVQGDEVMPSVLRFELLALRLLGHFPNLDTCVECGEPVQMRGRIAFGQLAGGVLCGKCRPGRRQVVSASAAMLQLMKNFSDTDNNDWRKTPVDPAVCGELRGLLTHYITHLIGHKPRMYRYLGGGSK
ncbi:MAG: DNA repair protein RecO [Pirellulales bacterium]